MPLGCAWWGSLRSAHPANAPALQKSFRKGGEDDAQKAVFQGVTS